MGTISTSFLSRLESRREFLQPLRMRVGTLAFPVSDRAPRVLFANDDTNPIKVSVLHSLTGTMATTGQSLVDGIQMVIDEVNQQGGVLGRTLQAIIKDGTSDPTVFSKKAEKLILEDRVQTIFGCWTSASRKVAAGIVFGAPQGLIRTDPHNQHTWKVTRIGQIQNTGQFSIVWSSQEPIHPDPYPISL